jgi:hypothetical protein
MIDMLCGVEAMEMEPAKIAAILGRILLCRACAGDMDMPAAA